MKLVIICKGKTKVKMIGKCNGEDLASMGIAIIHQSVERLSREKRVNRKDILGIIKELLDQKLCKFE